MHAELYQCNVHSYRTFQPGELSFPQLVDRAIVPVSRFPLQKCLLQNKNRRYNEDKNMQQFQPSCVHACTQEQDGCVRSTRGIRRRREGVEKTLDMTGVRRGTVRDVVIEALACSISRRAHRRGLQPHTHGHPPRQWSAASECCSTPPRVELLTTLRCLSQLLRLLHL